MSHDPARMRRDFPALQRWQGGHQVIYVDGPSGTQVPTQVIDAMSGYLERGAANLGGHYPTSRETGAVVEAARNAAADLLGAGSHEIVFGQNMTSLTFALSRALSRTWEPGDEVVVTRLDHDANVTPWVRAAGDAGAEVRWADFDTGSYRLEPAHVAEALGPRTRLVAVTAASNALGTIVDVEAITAVAHDAGALVYVDGVHRTPHTLVDVTGWGVDFYAASAYKFFGPHLGMLYGRGELLEDVEADKVRPAPNAGPGKWETGTQSFESLAGLAATVDYLAGLGEGPDRRSRLRSVMAAIHEHGGELALRFLSGLAEMAHIEVAGINDDVSARTPTFSLLLDGDLAAVQRRLADEGIYATVGHFYATPVMERLERPGALRVGFVATNTADEVDRVLTVLDRLG